ncbi:MAG TPA: HNH endonuclease, partial [Planctomycetaceae bacterium]|nr:HNH endonuclease [Planctomycetaceae bacterium]
QYCGATRPASQLSLDHVVPRSQGGKTTWNNIVSSCLPCNSKKGGRTPSEARMKLLNEPKMPDRNPAMVVSQKDAKYQIWEAFVPTEDVANT